MESAGDLTRSNCSLTEFGKDKSFVACFCVVVSKRLSVMVSDLFYLFKGSFILLIIISDILLMIVLVKNL